MNNQNIKPLKLRIRYEIAYEIIFSSIIVILLGLAYLFASNLLTFNWYTVAFVLLILYLLYLKYNSYLIIKDDWLSVYYYKYFKKYTVGINNIEEIIFYEDSRKVEIITKDEVILNLYLSERNKEFLLDWFVQYYPSISCLYINK